MGNRRKTRRAADPSCSHASTSGSDELSETEEEATTPPRRPSHGRRTTKPQRSTWNKKDNVIQILEKNKEDIVKAMSKISKELTKQVHKLTESHNELRKQLELHINGSSGDDSSAARSEISQVQRSPKYRLKFTCEVKDEIQKGQVIETKENGKTITVALYDEQNRIVEIEPYASSNVMLVVLNGEFNEHGTQYNWSKKEFERNIKRPRQGKSSMGDEHQLLESIVSNCVFTLECGVQSHSDATILYNSSNKKVRLGVMVLSPTGERVLEGLSNHFFVRGCGRPRRQKVSVVGGDTQEGNGQLVITQNPTFTNMIQQNPTSADMAQPEEPRTYDEQFNFVEAYMQRMNSENMIYGEISPIPTNVQVITNPVQLLWDRPNVDLSRFFKSNSRWNLLDHLDRWRQPNLLLQQQVDLRLQQRPWLQALIQRHSTVAAANALAQPNGSFDNCLPTTRLMSEEFRLPTILTKDVMQPRGKRGVRIEPLEPDDSDEARPLKRTLHSKYRLRFANEVCEAYCTWDQIKADDGCLLKVALFNENNMKITTGPFSSASIEVVVLHGDFNVDGQDYWTSEDFCRSIVCPGPGEEASSVLGGDCILVLADGEACLTDAFLQITSFCARTRKFKMGVMLLASAQEERIQEGISEPFKVMDYRVKEFHGKDEPAADKAKFNVRMPPGFRFLPTDEELVHYLCNRAKAKPCRDPIIGEVDIDMSDPWDLPAKAVYGEHEWHFFCPLDGKCPNSARTNRAVASGYWKATGRDKLITIRSIPELSNVGALKKTLVFYVGHSPRGRKTPWVMYEYRLNAWPSASSMKRDEWALCKIFLMKTKQLQLSLSESMDDDEGIGQKLSTLPLGFGFHPTDEELIMHYLRKRAKAEPCPAAIIAEVDIYKLDPWDLPAAKALYRSKWYFFSQRDRKYRNGVRTTEYGYWKATGTDKPITLSVADASTDASSESRAIIGAKKALVFHRGRPPKGIKMSWMMHEYRLTEALDPVKTHSTRLDDWVLCKIWYKNKTFPDYNVDHPAVPEQLDTLPLPLETTTQSETTTQPEIRNKNKTVDDFLGLWPLSKQFHTLPPETTEAEGSTSLTARLYSTYMMQQWQRQK